MPLKTTRASCGQEGATRTSVPRGSVRAVATFPTLAIPRVPRLRPAVAYAHRPARPRETRTGGHAREPARRGRSEVCPQIAGQVYEHPPDAVILREEHRTMQCPICSTNEPHSVTTRFANHALD